MPVALDAQHLGWILASVILLGVGSFAIGYFWGKRTGQKNGLLLYRATLLLTRYITVYAWPRLEKMWKKMKNSDNQENTDTEGAAQAGDAEVAPEMGLEMKTQHYAQLAGFASLRHAEAFVTRLNKKQILLLLKNGSVKVLKGDLLSGIRLLLNHMKIKMH